MPTPTSSSFFCVLTYIFEENVFFTCGVHYLHSALCHDKLFLIKPVGDDLDTPVEGTKMLELQPSVFDKKDVMYYKLKTLLQDYAAPDSSVVEGIHVWHYAADINSYVVHE